LSKYANNAQFQARSLQAIKMLETCAVNLLNRPEMIDTFVQKQGKKFYDADMEAMAQYPPRYGLVTEVQKKENKSDEHTLYRLSVLKGLWFPILITCTNLIMEAQSHLQKEALDCFFKILETAAPHFEIDFWHEILS